MCKKMLVFIFLMSLVPLANATSIIYTLDQDACSGTCGTPPFGTVTLTQLDPQTVLVVAAMSSGDQFVRTGAGQSLEFNITGDPAIAINDLTGGFSVGPAPATASAFGTFDYSIHCSGCGPGASAPLSGPLSFEVTLTGGGDLPITDFVGNPTYFFAADIIGTNGKTGNVAAKGPGFIPPPPTVPEPTSLLLLGTGLSGLALVAWRRRKF